VFWRSALEGESLEWMKLRSTRHARYWCGYHFVWIPKYRRDILVGDVAEYTRVVLSEILRELGCEPLAIEVLPDHVHVFALCPPRHSPAYIVNYLKGKSARRILQRFPELKTRAIRGKLWDRSYFVATVGNVTADIVKKYVEEQWEKER
jgi:putative transposase